MNLIKGELLQSIKNHRKFVRVGRVNKDIAYLFKIELGVMPCAPSKASYLKMDDVQSKDWKRISKSEDPFLLPAMRLGESVLSEQERKRRDEKWEILKPYVTSEREAELYDRKMSVVAIREMAEKAGKSQVTIRRWLTDYIYFGCDINACIGDAPNRGGPGKPRLNAKNKAGRYSASEMASRIDYGLKNGTLDGWERPGHPVTSADIKRFEVALTQKWAGKDQSLTYTHKKMCEEDYVQRNQVKNDDGTPKSHPLGSSYVPSLNQFKYRKDGIVNRLGLKQEKAGEKEYRERYASRTGSSSDIADGAIDIFDIDATPYPINILGGLEFLIPIKNPTVWIAVDRTSHAIIGFFDSLTSENWDGYRMCLFNAFTPKDDLLLELGFNKGDWPLYAIPRSIYVDNGPGMSDQAKASLVGALRLERIRQPPNHPMGKALVESVIGLLQRETSSEDGAWTMGSTAREKERRRKAIQYTRHRIHTFRRLLIQKIIEHNKTYHLPRKELTSDMLSAGLDTPEAVFMFAKKQRRGDVAVELSQKEIYTMLLPHVQPLPTVQQEGVKVDGQFYSCKEILRFRERKLTIGSQAKRNPVVDVCYDPLRPGRLYWFDENVNLQILLPNSMNAREQLLGQTWLDEKLIALEYRIRGPEITKEADSKDKGKRRGNTLSGDQMKEFKDAAMATGASKFAGSNAIKGQIAMARKAEKAKQDAQLRKRTEGYLPQPDIGAPSLPKESSDSESAGSWEEGLEQAFDDLFRK